LSSTLPADFIIFNYHSWRSDFQPILPATSKSIFSYLNVYYQCFKLRLVAKLSTELIFPLVLKLFSYHSSLSSSSYPVFYCLAISFSLISCHYFKVPCYYSPLNTCSTRFSAAFRTAHPSNATS